MAMINMEILHIIMEIYEELLNTVILKNIPKDCPNIEEIKDNYLGYLFENYKSHKPTEDKESVKSFQRISILLRRRNKLDSQRLV